MFWKFLKKFAKKSAPAKATQNSSKTPLPQSVLQKRTPAKSANEPAPVNTAQSGSQITLPMAFLQKLVPIGGLRVRELQALTATQRIFKPGEIIFNRGDNSDALAYLHEGEVYLEAANGSGYSVDATTFKGCYPLSTDTDHRFSAIAKLPATSIVYFPLSVLQRSSTAVSDNNPLINPEDVPAALRNSAFFKGFCVAFRKDVLKVPSLPDVALRLRSALKNEISIADAVKIINLDPVISSKLIQVVNSPLYGTRNPITNIHDAIIRLGLKTTHNLVTSISLYNLFRSSNKLLNDRINQLWKQSIQISSLSYTLASLSHKINADEALLAGLIHNIGVLPIITYAETLDDEQYTEQELDQTIAALKGLVGEFILKKWHFPESLLKIPNQTSNWYHDDNPALQLSDIVLLARFHSQLGSGSAQKQQLPPLNTLPAFLKLGDNALTADMSLQALQDAKQQIANALDFFKT